MTKGKDGKALPEDADGVAVLAEAGRIAHLSS